VEWYDLDLPEVIELRLKLVGGEAERYHLLGISALDPTWMDRVSMHLPRPFLFLALAAGHDDGFWQRQKEITHINPSEVLIDNPEMPHGTGFGAKPAASAFFSNDERGNKRALWKIPFPPFDKLFKHITSYLTDR